MEMEPGAAWGPCCEFQLADWTVEEPVAEVWAPAPYSGLPVQYASVDIFGSSCSLPAYLPQSVVSQEQIVEYYNPAGTQQGINITITDPFGATITGPAHGNTTGNQTGDPKVSTDEMGNDEKALKVDTEQMKQKMHRYPASLGDLDKAYTVPRIVAIGPYHDRNQTHLKLAEEMKLEAVKLCIKSSGNHLKEELFAAVVPATDDVLARGLYDKDEMARIGHLDFYHMMFIDACFLVQYMLARIKHSRREELDDSSLHSSFLSPNLEVIFHDVMLLENQLPWNVVQAVIALVPNVCSRDFVASLRGWLQDHKPPKNEGRPLVWDERYKPPHLLGLLRYYTVGRSSDSNHRRPNPMKRSVSSSAMELARIGITLTPNKTTELIHMGLNKKWVAFKKLSLPPLSLNRDRASCLVNMAALELCTVPSFGAERDEESAICSYLLLLAMLAYREEDVDELRRSHLLQGGVGLTNEEALSFFTSLQGLRRGRRYIRIMKDIESYKENKPMLSGSFRFYNDNNKTIKIIAGGVASVGSIIGTLLSFKDKL